MSVRMGYVGMVKQLMYDGGKSDGLARVRASDGKRQRCGAATMCSGGKRAFGDSGNTVQSACSDSAGGQAASRQLLMYDVGSGASLADGGVTACQTSARWDK